MCLSLNNPRNLKLKTIAGISRLAILVVFGLIGAALPVTAFADIDSSMGVTTSDRVEIVTQQIALLKNRYQQAERELVSIQHADASLPIATIEQASKNLLDKAALDISISKSNLESISIELGDASQTVSWLDKNIQEINNQLNVLSVFGNRIARTQNLDVEQLHTDLAYQQRLIALEKQRMKYLRNLEADASAILQIKKDQLAKLNAQLKSQRLQRMKQQEVRDELAYQEQQNQWLQRLNVLYARLAKLNPATAKEQYSALEGEIFAANEHANYAYTQSLIARYRDQIHQLKQIILKSSSIGQLTELGDQEDSLSKQVDRLNAVLKTRMEVLKDHIEMHSHKKNQAGEADPTMSDLLSLQGKYELSAAILQKLNGRLDEFRVTLDHALQSELSARQGFPSFDARSMLDIGKEMLLVPALTFQVIKSLAVNIVGGWKSATALTWSLFILGQVIVGFIFVMANRVVHHLLTRPSVWRERVNSKWLSLKWLDHHLVDLYVMSNIVGSLFIFCVPVSNYIFFVYLAGVWFIFKSIIVIARICLVETMNHTAGKDMRLYQRLRWIFLIGGVLTAAAVFIYQLPLMYELKALSDRLFLLFMMVVSVMLLRFWDVVPNMILSHMDKRHPYFEKSVRILGVLIPLLLLGNSAIGLLGYVNLVMTVSWYEGVFLVVLMGYLVLRGLLTDSLEQVSRIVIQHSSTGWLLSEAFLKPLDRVLRLFLLLSAGALLFLIYGWDQQSPIVERLNGLLHYEMVNVSNISITPLRVIGLFVIISVFYWTAKWTREFVFRLLASRTTDMGIRNSVAIICQYCVVVLGVFFSLQVLGIDLVALKVVAGMLAFGVGLGLRDLANNFFCGFLILLERPLRVGDIIAVNDIEGEVVNIGGRAVTVMTWDHTVLVVPNVEIFNKTFTNLTARDNILRCIVRIKISRHDNPHQVQAIIHQVISENPLILSEPKPEVFLKEMNDLLLGFELRYYVNIRQVSSRTMVASALLMAIWDSFDRYGIKPPYPQQEIFIRNEQFPASGLLSVSDLEERELLRSS